MDGREIKIFPDVGEYDYLNNNYDLVPVSEYVKDGDVIRVVGNADQLSYTRFGMIKDNGNSYMVAQGRETLLTEMPVTGVATYRGNAVIDGRGFSNITAGSAEFNVDFGNRDISGTMSFIDSRSRPPIIVELNNGTINGNDFSGTSSQGAEFKGSFHGPNAEELGGVYRKQGEYDGAFGAKR